MKTFIKLIKKLGYFLIVTRRGEQPLISQCSDDDKLLLDTVNGYNKSLAAKYSKIHNKPKDDYPF